MRSVSLLFAAAFTLVALTGAPLAGDNDAYVASVEEWYEGRIERLQRPTGYLALVGLFPLEEGTWRFGSDEGTDLRFPDTAPLRAGILRMEGSRVWVAPEPGVHMRIGEAEFSEVEMIPDSRDGTTRVQMGTYTFYVIERGESYYLRVLDTEASARKSFKGIERFAVDAAWRVRATFNRYPAPRTLLVPDILGHVSEVPCPGSLDFTVSGETYRLEPMSSDGDEWFIVFGDATSGQSTYGGGRFVYVPAPDENGVTWIDFNHAYNPPCAFSPYATCPLPHPENVLKLSVIAGEKSYGGEHHH